MTVTSKRDDDDDSGEVCSRRRLTQGEITTTGFNRVTPGTSKYSAG